MKRSTWREGGWREGGREAEREGGREAEREGGREGEREGKEGRKKNEAQQEVNAPVHVHGKHVYSTLALGKEREIVKEETALRKEKEAVCCYVHADVHV